MDIVLIPGFWLDASSWDEVVPVIEAAGHTAHPLTPPGLDSPAADRRGIRLADHVAAVVDEVDRIGAPLVLVGHSGGGPVAHAAADARPDAVVRVVHVDTVPLPVGRAINDGLPVVDGEIPLPDWPVLGEESLRDLDDDLLRRFRERAIPEPARVATDPQTLSDPRRHAVPATVIACEFTSAQLSAWLAEGDPDLAEVEALTDLTVVDLPTGHWPQFTRPVELAEAIVAAVGSDPSG
jgi:pimeloyl-ACP methyl ester carboxylesterase